MSVFVNCTDPTSACEASGGGPYSFLGVAGTCDVASGLCLCPPGYSGIDLLSVWNDCHIREQARVALEATSLAINVLAHIMVSYGIISLLRSWEARPIRLYGLLPWIQFPPPSPSQISYQRQMNERRKRRIFIAIFASLLVFSNCGILFQAILLGDPVFSVFERPNGFGIFLMTMDITSIMVALYMVLYAWFDALPSFRLFSKMFPQIRDAFLVRYPNFVFLSVVLNIVLTATVCFGLFFLLSVARPDLIRSVVIPWGMTVFAIELVIYLAILLSVCVLLIRLLNVFSGESSRPSSPGRATLLSQEARSRFRDARHTIYVMFFAAALAGPWAIVLCFMMAWHPYALANFFFFVSMLQAAGAAVALLIVYVFVFRMQYAKKRPVETVTGSIVSGQVEPRLSGDGSISLGGEVHSPNPKFSFLSLDKSSVA